MHFVVHALDKPGTLDQRLAVIDQHRAYVADAPKTHGITVLMSGPLIADDGETMKGSFFLLDAPNRASIEAMFADDPIKQADIWGSLSVTAVHIRTNNMSAA